MGRKLVADRGANEVRAVRIKAFSHQQIDVTEVHVTQVDCYFLGVAGFVVKRANLPSHVTSTICTDGIWMVRHRLQVEGSL